MRATQNGRWEDAGMDAVRDAGMDDRLTVAEAAERLGITKEAVRKRIHRDTLRSDRAADGTVMVYVPPSGTPDGTPGSLGAGQDELVEELREQVSYLRSQLDVRAEEIQRRDVIISQLTQATSNLTDRLRELEPPTPPGERESPVPSQTPTEASDQPETGAQEPEHRGFWRRLFGG
jgi:excisionase family DNA binding protein